MTRIMNRRRVLMASTAVMTAAIAGRASAENTDIQGVVRFEGDAVIPKGRVTIFLDDPAAGATSRDQSVSTQQESDGASTTVSFALPAQAAGSATSLIVAQLEREDGWLLARGSAKPRAGQPVDITLNTVMY